ncbi:MAG: methyl-accepting chemotaxis protein [Desulfobacterales bacterium]|nr:methyl-accepting chemotaxis protein [Desulfobacterales bacterium]
MKRLTIKFKLIVGGLLAVLVPIVIISTMSVSKSSSANKEMSLKQLKGIAKDMTVLTDKVMTGEVILAKSLASDSRVASAILKVNESGERGEEVEALFKDLKNKFRNMGPNHEGIFVTNKEGLLFTGIMSSGKEYKGANIGDRNYFKKAISTGDVAISDIIRNKISKELVSAILVPVYSDSNEFIGSLCLVIKVDFLVNLISTKKIGKSGYPFMVNKKGIILAHPKSSFILNLNIFKTEGVSEAAKEIVSGRNGVAEYTYKGTDKTSGFAKVNVADWFIVATQNNDEFFEASRSIRNFSIVVTLIALTIIILFILFGAQKIVKPINAAVLGLQDIANGEGNLTMRLDVISKDEVGDLAIWFNNFIVTLQKIIKKVANNSIEVSSYANELSSISSDMSLKTDETSQRSDNVAASTTQMNANINNVAAAMEQSSSNLNMVSAAAEEMTSTIGEIANNTENARNISAKAVKYADEVSDKVTQLETASHKISEVTETINDISEQTNLLALNATIEAARAGESGKGFAVVANEIKELAQQTANATKNIKGQINDIQSNTSSAVSEINEISDVIGSMDDIIVSIASAIEEQSTATKEIADNISQASSGIQEVNENINQSSVVSNEIAKDISAVTVAVSDISSSSTNVKQSAVDLREMAEELTGLVGSFKV